MRFFLFLMSHKPIGDLHVFKYFVKVIYLNDSYNLIIESHRRGILKTSNT